MAPDLYTRTGSPFDITSTWVDVNSTTSATETMPTTFYFRRRRVRYYCNNSTTTWRDRRRLNTEEKKLLAKRKAKQILDKKSKEGVRKINFNSILKPQVEKKQLFLNHKINSNRGG